MADSYYDKFRDARVKQGKQRKIKKICKKCHSPELLEIEITRTAYPYDERFAGFDFCCPKCFYKYKETVEGKSQNILIERPGLYIKSSTPNIIYTSNIAQELILFFNTRLETHPFANDEEKVDFFEVLRKIAMDEYKVIDEIFTTRMLIASEKGNVDEDMFDHIWRVNWNRKTDFNSMSWLNTRKGTIAQVINGYCEVLGWWKTGTFSLT